MLAEASCILAHKRAARHRACVQQWLAKHKDCPECREAANRRDLFR